MARKTWTDESTAEALGALSRELGRMPSAAKLKKLGRSDLASQVTARGGFRVFAERLGFECRRAWTDEVVAAELSGVASELGRMPSVQELSGMGKVDLANQIARRGGFREWARQLGLALKASETKTGQDVEALVAEDLKRAGLSVERQTTKAPFDLLVSGVRVDVKSARFRRYVGPSGHVSEGYFFGINKRDPTCDLYVLCCLTDDGWIARRYYVPSGFARVGTLTMTPTGKTYARFFEAFGELERLVVRLEAAASGPRKGSAAPPPAEAASA